MSELSIYRGSSAITEEEENKLDKAFGSYYGNAPNLQSDVEGKTSVCPLSSKESNEGNQQTIPGIIIPNSNGGWIKVATGFGLGLLVMKLISGDNDSK